ncbi:hypothetical protein [Parvibium lacunae]|uniref:Uncharacterized protein n=1 Tax=Parvibium lacunae TaxID=1888893 RepID=A0A368KYX6_9BURK|nr:hypothetical protein [Parvibium lacunae]RCS56595.1 hypothetical protein DU000_11575 [Parvibium lacunae]
MRFFLVEPEVAGGLGEKTVMDSSIHPPKIQSLEYVFDGWSGDVLLTSFPAYIVTSKAREILERFHASGISFAGVDILKSETFNEFFPEKELPEFFWMKVEGTAGQDDFGLAPNLRLVISGRALDELVKLRLSEAVVSAYE